MAGACPAPPLWYHRDLSRAAAEELLARAGRDGSFLLRDSESVNGAYALCVLFQKHVHTYRILPDEENFLAVQVQSVCVVTASNGLSTISHEYLKSSYALDLEAVKQGANSLPHLNKTLVASCKRLHGEVDKVLCGLEILSKVFDQQSASMVSRMIQQTMSQGGDQELEHLVTKLAILKDLLSSIEKKALKALQDMSSSTPNISPLLSIRHKAIPVQTFEVKLDVYLADLTKIGKSQKYSLSVDVEGGKLVVMKKMKDAQEDWNTFTHDKIRQLIKSQRVQNKLGIVFEKEKDKSQRKDFIFASAKKREAFCQLLQLMKNKHSNQDEPDMISIFIGTWNMGGVPAPKSMGSWILSRGLGKTLDEMAVTIPHDIYVFGTQENSVCDKEWVETLRCALKDYTEIDYKPIAVQTLWNIKIVVLVKAEHENRISHVGMSSVKTGIVCFQGNKGAVGVSFMFNGTSFGFVNCHLTSGNEKIHRRNQNYLDILRQLSLGDKQLNSFDISLRFTHLFWFGDLNYRLDMDIQEILNYINRKEFEPLLKVDQLNLEREKNKVFLRFAEEEITYPPTYRYERGSRDTYVWQKQKATGRSKQDPFEGDATTCKNSFNNPAYYILEGVPNQSAALASDMLPPSALPLLANKTAPPAGGVGKNKPPSGSSAPGRRQTSGRPVRPISEEGSLEDDGNIGSLNRPPPDFPPPPLPKGALETAENSFRKPQKLTDIKIPAPSVVPSNPLSSPSFVPPSGGGGGGVAFSLETPPTLNLSSAPFRRGGGALGLDDQSCSVLQMAKTLSEVEYPSGRGVLKMSAPHIRGLTFPPRSIQEESIAEDLPEEGLWHDESSSSSLSVECSVGEWLQKLGLQHYEEGLLHNGWDDLEFLCDITEEDLEEAGIHDPAHKKILLASLKQQQQQK
ncbi:phosphatidylinositol 3,4,5-trisphosphate 5-phosphatase 2A [Sinocyclocheilus rhinocerous]|uniref:phosphatidylinositol 3,4,5-trisphosphate 5-phosphatase 2A n=1 Tax=Sinocyclocheilus rhinocerous TaxID=307959 RepID=UPI0007B90F98|nr:PREDICTED: phosphatidylinositol 3,4,5-trisphosphate 5-phosphatase 2 [Sinocyclocheilus rhinocerous]